MRAMSHGDGPTNRLVGELSPYLLLHQNNPVDWYPWGEEALQRARDEDKPIFLSVGYATCYWCHVMERESFADAATAELMNAHFVNIKLDREERPDLDEIYMAATQLLTSQGGWPNSLFLTPELKPYFAGTYFPPQPRHGMPSFQEVLRAMIHSWQNRRDDVETQGEELEVAIKRYLEERGAPSEIPGPEVASRAAASLATRFDEAHGGFGSTPKFPTPSNLYLLDQVAQPGADEPSPAAVQAERMLDATLDQMARGGLYDQLGGGFHRYAVDQAWRVPHFEKMLYDNGHLLVLYSRAFRRAKARGDETRAVEYGRIVRETAAFLGRDMGHPEGGFFSAIDAETGGFEGGFHVWTATQLRAVLGPEDFAFLAPIYGFDGAPFFEGDYYVLHLPESLHAQAARRHMGYEDLVAQIAPLRDRLFAARADRPPPLVDDKILADWNGMAIAGLAEAGRHLGDDALTEQAAHAAAFVLEKLRADAGTLHHCWRDERRKQPAMVADYAFMIRGLLDLHRASDQERWLEAAAELAEEQEARLADRENGGYFVAEAAPDLLARSREVFDGALPSTNAISALNLIDLAKVTGEDRWRGRAESVLRAFGHFAERQGDATRMLCVAVSRYHEACQHPGWPMPVARASAGAGAADGHAGETGDPVSITVEFGAPDPEGWRDFALHLSIEDGWHLDAPRSATRQGNATHGEGDGSGEGAPARLEGIDAELERVTWPAAESVQLAPGQPAVDVFRSSDAEITGRVRACEKGAALAFHYQPCDALRCQKPCSIAFPLDPAF